MARRSRKSTPPPRQINVRWPAAGSVVEIPVGEGRFAYAIALRPVSIRVFDAVFDERVQNVGELADKPTLFVISISDVTFRSRRWPVIGKMPVDPEDVPPSFVQDEQGCRILRGSEMTRATPEECIGLERAAVWYPEHVESRLADHFAGRPNVYAEHLKLRL